VPSLLININILFSHHHHHHHPLRRTATAGQQHHWPPTLGDNHYLWATTDPSQARDGCYVTTTTPSRSQTRVGGVSRFVFFATAATSPPPPPLAHKREAGLCFTHDDRHVITTTPSRSQSRGGGGSSFVSLAPPAMSPPPSPLARKRELGVVLGSFHLHHLPRHHHHPLSLANASWGWSSVRFTRTTRHVTTTIPSRSQTRVGGGPQFVSLATPTSPPPPLARHSEVGVFLGSFHSRYPLRHHHHPHLAHNRGVGVCFARDGRRITTTTPAHS
jgi:hypothetical protein